MVSPTKNHLKFQGVKVTRTKKIKGNISVAIGIARICRIKRNKFLKDPIIEDKMILRMISLNDQI